MASDTSNINLFICVCDLPRSPKSSVQRKKKRSYFKILVSLSVIEVILPYVNALSHIQITY